VSLHCRSSLPEAVRNLEKQKKNKKQKNQKGIFFQSGFKV
jgi:hypothetical protein